MPLSCKKKGSELIHMLFFLLPAKYFVSFILLYRIGQFAELYSKKLGISESGLKRTLWGDYYLNMKTKRVTKGAQVKVSHIGYYHIVTQGYTDSHKVCSIYFKGCKCYEYLHKADHA